MTKLCDDLADVETLADYLNRDIFELSNIGTNSPYMTERLQKAESLSNIIKEKITFLKK